MSHLPQYLKLRDEILHHDKLYYEKGRPEISDLAYDTLVQQLKRWESENPEWVEAISPSQNVGVAPEGETTRHLTPMYSLDNVFNEDELNAWMDRVERDLGGPVEYTGEPKYDGVSINLIYRNGRLDSAALRGNGMRGEIKTEKARYIKNIPDKLRGRVPETLEIRGEVCIAKKQLAKINESMDKPFKSCRNAAAGTLRLKDNYPVKERGLYFYPYALGEMGSGFEYYQDKALSRFKELGFRIRHGYTVTGNRDKVINYLGYMAGKRDRMRVDIDGLVIKVNRFVDQEALGYGSKYPKHSIAFKFPSAKASTIIEDVFFQVGRTGSITPVAKFKKITLGGVDIQHASLHNRDEIERLGLALGSEVIVARAGDVIPKVTKVLPTANTRPVEFPDECPSCTTVLKDDRCLNTKCSGRLVASVVHFASRGALDIKGLGFKTVRSLVKRGKLTKLSDIFALKEDDFGLGELTNRKLYQTIQAKSNPTLKRFIYGLGVDHVGLSVAADLERRYGTIDSLMATTAEAIAKVDGVGEATAESLMRYLRSNVGMINTMRARGLKIKECRPKSDRLKDKRIVVTGSFENTSRPKLYAIIESAMGSVRNTVTKDTDYLLAGENAGSKLDRAKDLGVEVIDLAGFYRILKK